MKQQFFDGCFLLLFLTLAVLAGYAILAPATLLAAAEPRPAPSRPDTIVIASLAPTPPGVVQDRKSVV